MRLLFISLLLSLASLTASAQYTSRVAALKANESKLIYPLYKGSIEMGVMPVEKPEFNFHYKGMCRLVFDISGGTPDSARNSYNWALMEAMRILNLHAAAGVPKEKMDAVVVFHGPSAVSFLNDEPYNKRFKMNNPNLALIKQLQDNGVKFVVCGQTMGFRNLSLDAFPSGVQRSMSARTATSDLQQRGYVVYEIGE